MRIGLRSLAALLVASLALLLSAGPANAHTGFESSDPADGAVVDGPIDEITLVFSGEATPAGEGFVVLDSSGVIRVPDEITSTDNLTWVLGFDQPLAGGDVGVRWMVAAPDAHPIDGSFRFTVAATPAGEGTDADVDAAATDEVGDVPAEPVADVPDAALESPDIGPEPAEAGTSPEPAEVTAPIDLEAFLDTGESKPAGVDIVAAIARILGIVGAVLVIGGAAFAAFGLRGDAADVRNVLYWVRRGGVLLILGALGRAVATVVSLGGDWSALTSLGAVTDALWSSTGLAIGLRAVGGFLAASRTGLETTRAAATRDPVVAARQLAAVGVVEGTTLTAPRPTNEPFVYEHDQVWDHRFAIGGLVGVLLVSISFAFDGHTASEGPRWLHAIANLAHVTTASIWAGGVAMLALTMWRRHRRDRPTQALQLAMRFSIIATIALAAAGLAGVALSAVILDSVSEIWSTPWGRLLALKVALVAAAATGGAYNHRTVVPALDRNPDDPGTIDHFRVVVTFEAVALVAVAVVTAFLIAASSS